MQAGRTTLTKHGAAAAGPTVALKCIRSKRAGDAKPFCHAKFYAFITGADVTLLAGSANCSAAALLSAGALGNAELLSVQRMSRETFDGAVLGELEIDALGPESLPLSVPTEEGPTAPMVRVLGASLSGPTLRVAYVCPGGWHPVRCDLDGEQHVLREGLPSSGYFDLSVTSAPSRVILHATDGSTSQQSGACWIDNEFALSTTSRERQIAAGLAGNVQPSQWNLKTWMEVMRLLGEHLRYTPATIPGALLPGGEGAVKDGADTKLSASRLFIDHYTLPSAVSAPMFSDEDARILGLHHLLLDYFGVGLPEDDSVPTVETEADQTSAGGDDEAVDLPLQIPAKLPKIKPKREKVELSDAERKRARKIAGQIVDRLVDPKFLENRPPARLKTDLTIAAVLIVCGVAEDWLPGDAFLELTYRAWISLFLDGQPAPAASPQQSGWLTRLLDRYDRSAFAAAMCSPELAASLATWGFLCPEGIAGVDAVRFHLASRVAVARLPWLWGVGQIDEVAIALRRVMATAGRVEAGDEEAWERVRHQWDKMLAEGLALGSLESFLLTQESPAILKTLVTSNEVPRGTLLWQGRKIGFCVAMNDYRRDSSTTARVMSLTGDRAIRNIQAGFLLPLPGLIALANIGDKRFVASHSEAISRFAAEMLEMSAKAKWSEDDL